MQVVVMCTWAYEYYKLTGQMPNPYLPYMLWAQLSEYKEWAVLTIADVTLFKYWAKYKERWKYLIVLLQFRMDNNALTQIKGSPIWLMSALAKLMKDTANHVFCHWDSTFRGSILSRECHGITSMTTSGCQR